MPKYIEREKLIDELQRLPEQGELDYLGVFDCVNTTPTADVVKVVRCGQCGNYCKNNGECNLYGRHPNENDFCSSGIKEREQN